VEQADSAARLHVLVVGGGISGLSAAYSLQATSRRSGNSLRITLVEAEPRLGGKILTERNEGNVIEAGPDSFLSSKPAALKLCEELGLDDAIVGATESGGGTYILRSGRLEPLPEGITMLVPTKIRPLLASRLLTPWGKLRMGLDFFIPPRRDDADESVGQFVRRRLGNEAFERMAQPLLSGIYAGDAEQLSLLATFPRLRDVELKHGSLTKGMLDQRRQAKASPPSTPRRSAFLSLKDGLGAMIDALGEALTDVDVRLGTAVSAIERSGEAGYDVALSRGERLQADAMVLAIPAFAAADLLTRFDSGLAGLLSQIPYVSTATVTLAYRRADVTQTGAGRGFVIPKVEDRELTAVTWVTNKFAGRAPDDVALVRGFVGRAGREEAVELSDAEIIQLVCRELAESLGLDAEPIDALVFRWRRALPQYVLGHVDRVKEIEERVSRLPGMVLAGAAYRGVGIPDCIQSGQRAAERVLEQLDRSAATTAPRSMG
jgi:oxygen-dependent protoporphyrinogen oxidase